MVDNSAIEAWNQSLDKVKVGYSSIDEWKQNPNKVKVGEFSDFFRNTSCEFYLDFDKSNTFFVSYNIVDEARHFYLIHFYEHQKIFVFELIKDFGQDCRSFESGAASVISEKAALSFIINKIVEETINEQAARKRMINILEKSSQRHWKK